MLPCWHHVWAAVGNSFNVGRSGSCGWTRVTTRLTQAKLRVYRNGAIHTWLLFNTPPSDRVFPASAQHVRVPIMPRGTYASFQKAAPRMRVGVSLFRPRDVWFVALFVVSWDSWLLPLLSHSATSDIAQTWWEWGRSRWHKRRTSIWLLHAGGWTGETIHWEHDGLNVYRKRVVCSTCRCMSVWTNWATPHCNVVGISLWLP